MKIEVIHSDITTLKVDAIVNAANCTLLGGGGVDGAIHRKAGRELLDVCRQFNGCETGDAILTLGFNLPSRYIIHTPGPVWRGGSNHEGLLLEKCYKSCLKIVFERQFRTVAFPSISTGIYCFPRKKAAKIAIEAVMTHREAFPDKVIFCVFSEGDMDIYNSIINERARR